MLKSDHRPLSGFGARYGTRPLSNRRSIPCWATYDLGLSYCQENTVSEGNWVENFTVMIIKQMCCREDRICMLKHHLVEEWALGGL